MAPTATGAWVSRSVRASVDAHKTTPAAVGPGSYELAAGRDAGAGAAPVPFHTSTERSAIEGTGMSVLTPGVGAYDAHRALDAAKCKHVKPLGFSANFASGTARLHEDKTRVAVPGPGAYVPEDQWKAKSPHYVPHAPKQRIAFTRTPAPPSIPAAHQSYGYDESQEGELVMQRAQQPIHSGVKGDTVGPGSYDPKPVNVGANAVAWNGQTKRGLQVKSETPGPGAYDPTKDLRKSTNAIVVAINGVEVQFGGTQGSAAFASKVPLPSHSQPQPHQRTPGPGAYQAEAVVAVAAKAKQPPPPELQFFGSAARRSCQVDPMKSLAAPTYFRTPGPGAYDDVRASVKTTGVLRMGDPMPFDSTSSRFGRTSTSAPGPGDYAAEAVGTITSTVQARSAVGKAGVFGSQSARFAAKESASPARSPGPGNYDPKPVDMKPTKRGDAANFASKTSRFRAASAPPCAPDLVNYDPANTQGEPPKGHPSRLGPGAYEMADQWSKKGAHPGYKKPGFGSDASRPSPVVGNAATPGPGRYSAKVDVNEVYQVYHAPGKDTVFGSNQARFKGSQSFTPGPGYYNTLGDLVRKTHNISFNQPGQ